MKKSNLLSVLFASVFVLSSCGNNDTAEKPDPSDSVLTYENLAKSLSAASKTTKFSIEQDGVTYSHQTMGDGHRVCKIQDEGGVSYLSELESDPNVYAYLSLIPGDASHYRRTPVYPKEYDEKFDCFDQYESLIAELSGYQESAYSFSAHKAEATVDGTKYTLKADENDQSLLSIYAKSIEGEGEINVTIGTSAFDVPSASETIYTNRELAAAFTSTGERLLKNGTYIAEAKRINHSTDDERSNRAIFRITEQYFLVDSNGDVFRGDRETKEVCRETYSGQFDPTDDIDFEDIEDLIDNYFGVFSKYPRDLSDSDLVEAQFTYDGSVGDEGKYVAVASSYQCTLGAVSDDAGVYISHLEQRVHEDDLEEISSFIIRDLGTTTI